LRPWFDVGRKIHEVSPQSEPVINRDPLKIGRPNFHEHVRSFPDRDDDHLYRAVPFTATLLMALASTMLSVPLAGPKLNTLKTIIAKSS
jgi:hypothetical protein